MQIEAFDNVFHCSNRLTHTFSNCGCKYEVLQGELEPFLVWPRSIMIHNKIKQLQDHGLF
jgi:hypothetical protein